MEVSHRKGLRVVWPVIGGVLLVEIVVRFLIAYSLPRVLLAETVSFLLAAAIIGRQLRKEGMTTGKRRLHAILSVMFALGAVRSGLWLSGVEVYHANIAILLIALTLLTLWWRRRRRVQNQPE